MKFYASVRLDTRRKEILPDNAGVRIKVKVVKNKVAAPFQVVLLDVLFGSGIDTTGNTLDAATDLDVVERKGSWYAYKGSNLAQGRHNVVEMMKKDSDLAAQIETEVRLALSAMANPTSETEEDGASDDTSVASDVTPSVEKEAFLE